MSEQFQPGDMVECVDARRHPLSDPVMPVEGALYMVAEVFSDGAVHIAELNPHNGRPYHQWRFRKVYRPDAKFIERLTAEPVIMPPVRHPERVDA